MARKEVLLIWIFVELCALLLANCVSESSAEGDVPLTKFSQNVGGPTLKFLYWLVVSYISTRFTLNLLIIL